MSTVTINATVNAENDLFTAVEVTDIETGERVYYSGDLELANDEELDAFLMGKGFELDTEAAGTWEHGIVLSGTQRGRKVRTERAERQPRDRRPARPAVSDTERFEIDDIEVVRNGLTVTLAQNYDNSEGDFVDTFASIEEARAGFAASVETAKAQAKVNRETEDYYSDLADANSY